ncbi:methyltransferase, putative [Bodo saltans]|uniref:Methyltransferase, putative n=1 Tax=Bodo saltans TaxID=75058 RepID=A0A0S4J9X7_BODSA|nr:methyltransferase, putative [Bodo saltans]|eukprot:CUG87034.1 methyltransferase, putative [Bodo saltans]
MKVSASFIIALFCTALIINPIVLILLFSQATDEAISGTVSGWDATALNTVKNAAMSRSNTLINLLEFAAVGINETCSDNFLSRDTNSSLSSSSSSSASESNTTCLSTSLEAYSNVLSSSLNADASSEDSIGTVKLLIVKRLSTSSSTSATTIATEELGNSSELFSVKAVPSSLYPLSHDPSSSTSSDIGDSFPTTVCADGGGGGGPTVTCTVQTILGASLMMTPPYSNVASKVLLGVSEVSWCADAMTIAEDLIAISEAGNVTVTSSSNLRNSIVADALVGSMLSLASWAVTRITLTDYLLLVVIPPSPSGISNTSMWRSCPRLSALLPVNTSSSSPAPYTFQTSPSLLGSGFMAVNVSSTMSEVLAPSPRNQNWMLSMLTGTSWKSTTTTTATPSALLPVTTVLPHPYAMLLVSHHVQMQLTSTSTTKTIGNTSVTTTVNDYMPSTVVQSVSLSCIDVVASSGAAAASPLCDLFFLRQNATTLIQRMFPSMISSLSTRFSGCVDDSDDDGSSEGISITPIGSCLQQQAVFMEDTDNSLFLTSQWLGIDNSQQKSTLSLTADSKSSVTQLHLGLLLVIPSGTSRDLMSTSSSNSVVVSVSITALAFIATVAAMHFMFHPLKTVGTLLRACADIQLHDLEHQAPSYLHEIFGLQQGVERLVKRIRIIGRYMPDKSQLHTVLSQATDIQAFGDTPAAVGDFSTSKGGKNGGRTRGTSSGFVGGGIAHSVSVRLEYRSRKDDEKRTFVGKVRAVATRLFSGGDDDGKKTSEKLRDVYHRKRTTFEFVYGSQGDMFFAFMQQARERLGERIGEDLKLFCKTGPGGGNAAPPQHVSACTPITCDEELVDAIEECTNRTLHLIIIKSSSKNYKVWCLAVLSVIDIALLFNASVHVVNTAASDLQVSENTAVIIERAGIAIATVTALRLTFNLVAALYLVRTLSSMYHPLAVWVSSALQEVLVSVLLCSASLGNVHLLFSHTRLTSALRFNAPYSDPLFRYRLFRWCLWSLVLGDMIPLGLCIFAVGQLRGLELRTFFSIFVSSLMIIIFVVEHYLDALIMKLKMLFSSQDGFGGIRRVNSTSSSAGTEVLLLQEPSTAVLPQGDEDEDELANGAATTSSPLGDATAVAISPSSPNNNEGGGGQQERGDDDVIAVDAPAVAPSLYLGLSKRSASVLRISLHHSPAHFDNMDAIEIQQLCSAYLGVIFSETKSHGGIVLAVSNTEVTIGFNCHQTHTNHFTRCLGCYFSIRHMVFKTIPEWCVDDRERPRIMGGIVTGDHMVVGFAGSGEARSFQLLGKTHRELDNVCRMGAWYSAPLACNDEACKKIADECVGDASGAGAGSSSGWWKQSFATSTVATERMTVDSSGAHVVLLTRLIETVSDAIDPDVEAILMTSSPSSPASPNKKALKFADLTSKHHRRPPKMEITKVHEILWEEGCEGMVHSSKPCLAFLDRLGSGTNVDNPSSLLSNDASAARDDEDPVPLPELIRSHLALYPKDIVVHAILRRVLQSASARAVGPRVRSVIGIDETSSELIAMSQIRDGEEGGGASAANRSSTGAAPSKSSTIFQKICSSDKYKLYFTEL